MQVIVRFTTTAGGDPGELEVTVNVTRVNRATGAQEDTVSGEPVSARLDGWCCYELTPDVQTFDYLVTFYGTSFSITLLQTSIGRVVTIDPANVLQINNLPATPEVIRNVTITQRNVIVRDN